MASLSWREEYLSALRERSQIEKENQPLIDAYTHLADRFSSLAATTATQSPIPTASPSDPSNSNKTPSNTTPNTPTKTPSTPTIPNPSSTSTSLPQLKADLAEALRSKSHFQTRLKIAEEELVKLRAKSKSDGKRIEELVVERNGLLVRVRDRDEELRGKGKLIEDVQDEMVSLNLQLNMAEQQKKKLQKENKELVDRWMARMGEEADAMNDASKFS